jgi:hypothetical protein
MLDQKILKSILNYNPETGIFTWRKKPSKQINIGSIAGTKNHYGYVEICVDSKKYQSHRLAWLYVHGFGPEQQIDHINGDRSDNRICNLRDVSHTVNNCNQKIHREGKLPGCTFLSRVKKWQAQVKINGQCKYLGCYKTQQEAHKAYTRAKEKQQ